MDQDAGFSDEPDADAAARFGRQEFLNKVVSTIVRAHDARTSTVFGLIGPWGIGKTSMVRWIGQSLSSGTAEAKWAHVTFEPWAYQHLESLQLGFFGELASAFDGSDGSGPSVRQRLAKFAHAAAPFASLTAPFGVSGEGVMEGFASLLDGDQSLTRERLRLEKTLLEAKRPVLVIIDDVDRLSTDELLLTFKLVRLLGRLPYVHYLLCFDERTLLDVLSRTALVGEQTPSRARDYLEKVVQIRFDVPLLRESDATVLVDEGLSRLSASTDMTLTDAQTSRFASTYFEHIVRHFTTPRTIRRYFAQVEAFAAQLEQEVEPIDFLLIAWIRTMYPGLYDRIQRNRFELVESPRRLRYEPDTQDYRDVRVAFWRAALDKAGVEVDATADVAAVVGELFPRFRSIWQGKKVDGSKPQGLGIADDAYFDRYILFGVPPEDIRDSTVRRAIADVVGGESEEWGDAANHVQAVMALSPALVTEKLDRELASRRPIPVALYRWLAHLYDVIPPDDGLLSPVRRFEVMVALQLRATASSDLDAALDALATADSPILFLDSLRRAMSPSAGPDPTLKPVTLDEAQRARLSRRMRDHLASKGVIPRDIASRVPSVMWTWLAIDEPNFRDWMSSAQPPLDELELACMLIGTSHPVGVPNPVSSLNNLDQALLARFIDLGAFRLKYAAEIAAATAPEDTFFGWPDSPDERRRFVFWNLRREEVE